MDESDLKSPIVRFGLRFFAFLMIIIAPFVAYVSIERFLDGQSSMSWPTTQGKVISSAVEEDQHSRIKKSFKPRIEYQYALEKKEYVGSEISHHDVGYGDRVNADNIVAKYPVGFQLDVYYDPDDYSRAVLEPGNSWRAYLFLAVPIAMLGFGLLGLWSVRTGGSRNQKNQPANRTSPPSR